MSRSWCRTASRGVEIIAVSALATAITIVIAAPVLQAPSERIFGLAIVGRHHDPFTAMKVFAGPMVRGLYSQPLTDVPGALLARAAGPVAAYNWLVLLTFPLSAAATYALARRIALPAGGAALAAVAFAFSPFHIAQAAYHPHIAQTQWVPLYLLALWRCVDRPTLTSGGCLAVSVVGVTLSNFYGGLIAAAITPAALAAYWWCTRRNHPRATRRLAVTVASLAGIGGCGVLYAWRTASTAFAGLAATTFKREELFRYSANWWSYLVPPVAHPVLGRVAAGVWADAGVREGLLEQQVDLGWGLVILSAVALIAWAIHDRRLGSIAAVPVLATVALVALVCSLAPEGRIGSVTVVHPSSWLYDLLPMFRAYARFGVVVQLMTAILGAIGAEYLWRTGRPAVRVACMALVTLAVAEYAVWPPSLWQDVLPTQAHRWVARQAGHVRALDCGPLTTEFQSVPWLSNGRIDLRRDGLEDCLEPDIAAKLSSVGYTHLIVERNSPEGRWLAARPALDGFRASARFRDSEVFTVLARALSVYTVDLPAFYAREYDATWTWRWMGPRASWRIVNSSPQTVTASLEVEMAAFQHTRGLALLLDGRPLQTSIIGPGRSVHAIGPLTLTPGYHQLVFRPAQPPTVADDVTGNGDPRPLSFAVGSWRWQIDEEGR